MRGRPARAYYPTPPVAWVGSGKAEGVLEKGDGLGWAQTHKMALVFGRGPRAPRGSQGAPRAPHGAPRGPHGDPRAPQGPPRGPTGLHGAPWGPTGPRGAP